ncbi:hypothetical protein BJX65DRAFT_307779 [Aspergillus insuetus]
MKLGPNDLLRYDARYHVLICRECQYAIQKNAIQSHLLRHKIYRGDRRALLAAIAELDIVDPDDVPVPPSGSSPIDGISIVAGYRCLVSGCGHLCASSKRMKSHHSESHGGANLPDFHSFAQEVNLQTFFRGNKLRYFEVTLLSMGSREIRAGNESEQAGHIERSNSADAALEVGEGRQLVHISGSKELTPDLEILRYFHHFTSKAIHTLPTMDGPADSHDYWSNDVLPLALRCDYLMSGLLAISAGHLASNAEPSFSSKVHHIRSAQFAFQFFNAWQSAKKDWNDISMSSDIAKPATQVACILKCHRWMSAEVALDGSGPESSRLTSFITTMRDSYSVILSCSTTPRASTRRVGVASLSRPRNTGISNPADERLIMQLHDLPSRMAEALGKPENMSDVLATLDAVSALVECCELGYSSDEMNVAWQSIVAWPAMVPEHFHTLVSASSTPALVVLAHWAASLLQRVEEHGCWFLRGAAEKMLRMIRGQIAKNQDGPGVLPLLPGSLRST